MANGIWFPDQGWNLGPLHQEQSLSHLTTREILEWTLLKFSHCALMGAGAAEIKTIHSSGRLQSHELSRMSVMMRGRDCCKADMMSQREQHREGQRESVCLVGLRLSAQTVRRKRRGEGPKTQEMARGSLQEARDAGLRSLGFIRSVQFRRSVVSDPLRPHEPQHARPPCPSPSPGVHSDSRPPSP